MKALELLQVQKNRFGRTGEIGLFKMEEYGLLEIKNPSEFFCNSKRKRHLWKCIIRCERGK